MTGIIVGLDLDNTLVTYDELFHTLAIEQRSSEVWNVLGAVKTEFAKFGGVIAKAKEVIPGKPIRYVVTSHHHWDHLGGIRTAIDGKDMSAARSALKQTISLIDKMASKGIIHRNAAGRYKSRLTTRMAARG